MKKIIFAVSIFFLTSCSTMIEPVVTLEATISPLSEEDYKSIGTSEVENPTKEDFRKFDLYFEVNHSPENQVEIDFPKVLWKKEINHIDGKSRYWFGSGYEQQDEEIIKYQTDFIIYTKGITEQDIKKAYQSEQFIVKWLDGEGILDESVYSISDVLQFETSKK